MQLTESAAHNGMSGRCTCRAMQCVLCSVGAMRSRRAHLNNLRLLQLHAAKHTVSSKAGIYVAAQQVEHVVASCYQLSRCQQLQHVLQWADNKTLFGSQKSPQPAFAAWLMPAAPLSSPGRWPKPTHLRGTQTSPNVARQAIQHPFQEFCYLLRQLHLQRQWFGSQQKHTAGQSRVRCGRGASGKGSGWCAQSRRPYQSRQG